MIIICISIVDWVQMITQIVIAVTAVIMAVFAYRTYLKTPTQEKSKDETGNVPNSTNGEMTVFETSKQRTRLTINGNQIECFLLDKKTNKEEKQWTIDQPSAYEIVNTSNIYVNPNYKPNTGTFTIGTKRNWLYSKRLYPEPDYLKGELTSLLKQLDIK